MRSNDSRFHRKVISSAAPPLMYSKAMRGTRSRASASKSERLTAPAGASDARVDCLTLSRDCAALSRAGVPARAQADNKISLRVMGINSPVNQILGRLAIACMGWPPCTVPGAVATGFHRKRFLRRRPVATAPDTVQEAGQHRHLK